MGRKILVVDDDPMNLRMAEFALKQKGYDVLTASSGMDCLTVLQGEKTDLVLLDVEMPKMSGIETLKRIREDAGLRDLAVMFLTADPDFDTDGEAGRLGAAGCIHKPFLPPVLAEKIAQVIGE